MRERVEAHRGVITLLLCAIRIKVSRARCSQWSARTGQHRDVRKCRIQFYGVELTLSVECEGKELAVHFGNIKK